MIMSFSLKKILTTNIIRTKQPYYKMAQTLNVFKGGQLVLFIITEKEKKKAGLRDKKK